MPVESDKDRPRVIVGGTRTFLERGLLYSTMDRVTRKLVKPIIMTGGCKHQMKVNGKLVWAGADSIGELWALSRMHTLMIFHADRDKHGDKAGPIRNSEMVAFATERMPAFAVFFWDGKSDGTKDCIRKCERAGIQTKVVRYLEV